MIKKVSLLLSVAAIPFMEMESQAQNSTSTNAPLCKAACCSQKPSRWTLELGSGAEFGNVRDPKLDSYTLVPVVVGVSRSFDHIYLTQFADGIFSGHGELLADGYYTRVASGVERYIAGFHIGTRYDFTHLEGSWVPFAETTVGAADADSRQFRSNGDVHGLGQHFNFNFTVGVGVRYDINSRYFTRLTVQYVHYSNGGLSEPAHQNKALDCAGPILTVGFHF